MGRKVRRNKPQSGKDAIRAWAQSEGARGIPVKGWEKGDIVRDMVVQPDGPQIPRKPGSRRVDRTIEPAENTPKADAEPETEPEETQDK